MKKRKKTTDAVLCEMGARIRAERIAREWSQTDLAKAVELSQQWVSKVEKYGTREQENIMKLSKVLDRSPAYLQYGIEELANMSEEAIDLGMWFDELPEDKQEMIRTIKISFRKQPRK